MKTIIYLIYLFIGLFLMTSCLKDECTQTRTYRFYEPVYITQQEFEAPAKFEGIRPMENTGTIFAYGAYIFVNEFQKGVHIIDNHNPASPQSIGFIDIPGNTHFTIKHDILYANKLEDLLAIDISNIHQPRQVSRLDDMFLLNRSQSSDKGILAYYQATEETQKIDCNDYRYGSILFTNDRGIFFDMAAGVLSSQFAEANYAYAANQSSVSQPTLGVGGSMARFTTIDDRLYILSSSVLETVDISNASDPVKMGNISIQFNAETIYPFGENLYIGTTNGMHIYEVSESTLPQHIATTVHLQSCDPVISDGTYAYVTLRGGTECGGFTNQLEAYDLEDQFNPTLIQTYPMDNPHGLTKVGDYLYVCEGNGGWKKIKSNLPSQFKTEYINNDHTAFDVLYTPQSTLLFVGRKGIYQYDISGSKPKLTSEIEFVLP